MVCILKHVTEKCNLVLFSAREHNSLRQQFVKTKFRDQKNFIMLKTKLKSLHIRPYYMPFQRPMIELCPPNVLRKISVAEKFCDKVPQPPTPQPRPYNFMNAEPAF